MDAIVTGLEAAGHLSKQRCMIRKQNQMNLQHLSTTARGWRDTFSDVAKPKWVDCATNPASMYLNTSIPYSCIRYNADDKCRRYADSYHTCYVLTGLSNTQNNHFYTHNGPPTTRSLPHSFSWTDAPIPSSSTSEGGVERESEKIVFDEADRLKAIHPVFVIPHSAADDMKKWYEAHPENSWSSWVFFTLFFTLFFGSFILRILQSVFLPYRYSLVIEFLLRMSISGFNGSVLIFTGETRTRKCIRAQSRRLKGPPQCNQHFLSSLP